jgi:D-alanyl-lipoteichoic acid acyltransferase DltB (MBOAT superfamily)
LALSVLSNLGLLFFFKYYNFFISNLLAVIGLPVEEQSAWLSHWTFPVGISFYTFQTLSYTIDIFRGYRQPAKNLIYFSLYVIFFPQLLAGPIERSRFLLPQLEKPKALQYEHVRFGLRMILWGLFKKMAVGDRLGEYVDLIFDDPTKYNGSAIYFATFIFSIQLYCDFSAYTDIARGSARLFGVKLSRNFHNRVYFPLSRTHFWQGWHITLTTWFRDYLYIPLIGKSRSKARLYYGIFAVFILTGIWHGAAWGFIIWGGANGIWFLLERVTLKWRIAFFQKLGIWKYQGLIHALGAFFYLGTNLTTVLWFRAERFDKGWEVFRLIFSSFDLRQINIFPDGYNLWITIFMVLIMDLINIRLGKQDFGEAIGTWPPWQRWLLYLGLIELIFLFGKFDSVAFYYFQF